MIGKPGMAIAIGLELAMLGTFIANKSIVGMLLWLAYLWFSATWAWTFSHHD